MKINWRTELFPLACILIMFILAAIAWPNAPDQMPIHWGLDGEPDNYGGKFVGLLMIPLLALGIYGLFFILPKVDPKKANYAGFWNRYLFIRTVVIVMLLGIKVITFLWVMDVFVNMGIAAMILAGLVMVFLGNYLGKLHPTWFVGIRTPWTLTSDESWNKTHRLGGRMFVLIGLGLMIAGPVQQTWLFYTVGIGGGIALVYLYVYSWMVWKNDPDAGPLVTKLSAIKKERK